MLSTDLTLSLTQNIPWTGGTLFVETSAQRLDLFSDHSTSWQTSPINVGYSQSLFGYNSLKWNRRIEPLRYREAKKTYVETLELVAANATQKFFALATAQSNYEIASTNYANADTLYTYAQGRYNIGTITENEMLQLELNKLTEETNRMNAHIEVENCMQELRSYLGIQEDVIARLLYRCSLRYGRPFVTIDLGSIPEQLFESELFGYEKGAFTDARKPKAGRMEVATGGTLFLDEIGNLSLSMQAKLLTAIEKRQISRLGSTQSVPIDVRLICATNADIRHLVEEGNFRQDLLYRINTIELHIPPLRERGNDIILLADYFLQRYARKYQKKMRGLTREAKAKLLRYSWPGNVRELQHTMERAVILGDGSLLRPDDFLFQASSPRPKKEEEVLNLEQLERQAVEKAMRLSEGNMTRAAEYLGITRFALYRKIEKLGL